MRLRAVAGDIGLCALAAAFLVPIGWALMASFKPAAELFASPWSLPSRLAVENYAAAWRGGVVRYLANSALVTALVVPLTVLIAAPAAYALARLPLRAGALIFGLCVSGLLLPVHAVLIPVYRLSQAVHVWDLAALIGPYVAFGLPLAVLLLRAYFASLPSELIDAALIDGCSHWQVLWRIFMPISAPAVSTVAIFHAAWVWNELPLALVLIRTPAWQTLPFGLLSFKGQYSADWGAILAGVSLAIAPVLVGYVALQRYVVRGLTAGAVR